MTLYYNMQLITAYFFTNTSVVSIKIIQMNEMDDVSGHDSANIMPYCAWDIHSGLLRKILVWTMPQMQDQSYNLSTCSPVRYHCATILPNTRPFKRFQQTLIIFFLTNILVLDKILIIYCLIKIVLQTKCFQGYSMTGT